MNIGQANEAQLITRVVESLTDRSSVSSWTVVVPPGFGEMYVPNQIAKRLRNHPENPRLAFVKADRITTKADLLRQLYKQWNDDGIHSKHPDAEAEDLGHVLNIFSGDERKRILVVSRFHRILDWADESILQDLRDAEQAEELQTVVVCIYRLKWIKDQWRKKGRSLLASDYGVEHTVRNVQLVSSSEIFETFKRYNGSEIPGRVIHSAIGWTGGYPELMKAVIELWVDQGRPDLTDETSRHLLNAALEKAERIATELDGEEGTRFSELITSVHLRDGDGTERERLSRAHPWGELLVDDKGLRADAVGEACLTLQVQRAISISAANDPLHTRFQSALRLYRNKQFEQVMKILGPGNGPNDTVETIVLRNHASTMDAIYDRGIDADWRGVQASVNAETDTVNTLPLKDRDKKRLRGRLDKLSSLARAASAASTAASAAGSRRIIDFLTGLAGPTAVEDHVVALTLLVLQLESAKSTRGNSDSIRKILSMPEQLFRVWAWWKLGINYYCAPNNSDATWNAADEAWSISGSNRLVRAAPGTQFSGIVAFSYFAVARLLEGNDVVEAVPASDYDELRSQRFVFDWRNDEAHSVSIFNAKNRQKYFELVDNWLKSLCLACPHGEVERASLLTVVEPLPTLQDGRLIWQ